VGEDLPEKSTGKNHALCKRRETNALRKERERSAIAPERGRFIGLHTQSEGPKLKGGGENKSRSKKKGGFPTATNNRGKGAGGEKLVRGGGERRSGTGGKGERGEKKGEYPETLIEEKKKKRFPKKREPTFALFREGFF